MKALEIAETPTHLARSALAVNTEETARAGMAVRDAQLQLLRAKAKEDHLRWERTMILGRLRSLRPGESFPDPPIELLEEPGHINAAGCVRLSADVLLDHVEGTHVYFVRSESDHWEIWTEEEMHAALATASLDDGEEEDRPTPPHPTCPHGFVGDERLHVCVKARPEPTPSPGPGAVVQADYSEDNEPW